MSDKIKSEYKNSFERIEPSEEFLSNLTQTLEKEQEKQKKTKQRKIYRFRLISMAAACVIVILGLAAVFYFREKNTPQGSGKQLPDTEQLDNYTQRATDGSVQTLPIQNADWYNDSLTKESAPKALAQKLDSSLEYLSYNSENRFVNAEHADAGQIEQLTALLAKAVESSGSVSGSKVYYMAVFTDGTVAKFSITDDKFVEISGDEKIYEKTEK